MSEQKFLSRRSFLVNAGGAAAGIALATSGLGVLAPTANAATVDLPDGNNWAEYFTKPLDVEKVYEIGVNTYGEGRGCSEGGFRAITEALGEPFNHIPTHIMNYGRTGVAGWGTLCGALNGPAAAVSLVFGESQQATLIINELMAWYSMTPLPIRDNVSSVAGNPLCHASIANWCKASGKKSSERGPRCRLITGDVARQAAVYMNEMLAGTFVPKYTMSEETKACFDCHVGGFADDIVGKMDCSGCHPNAHGK